MGLITQIADWFRGGASKKAWVECPHPREKGPITVVVLGIEVTLARAWGCRPCVGKYLNENATVCASCKGIIFPSSPVAVAIDGAPYPYTHLTRECCGNGNLYCGRWGEGRLVTKKDLDAEGIAHPRRMWRLPSLYD